MNYYPVPHHTPDSWYYPSQSDNNWFPTDSGAQLPQQIHLNNNNLYEEDPLLFVHPEPIAARQFDDLAKFVGSSDFDFLDSLEENSVGFLGENREVAPKFRSPQLHKCSADRKTGRISIQNRQSPLSARSRTSSQTESSASSPERIKRKQTPITSRSHPEYRRNRDKNNIAVKKSRLKKKAEVAMTKSERDAFAVELQRLLDENQKKQRLLDTLEEGIRTNASYDELLKVIRNHTETSASKQDSIPEFVSAGSEREDRPTRKRKARDESN